MAEKAKKYIPFFDPSRTGGKLEGEYIENGAIKKGHLSYKVVTVEVAASSATGSSNADSELVGGEIIGFYPAGNQDQFVDSVVLNENGSITITLADNATAKNTFKVVVMKP